MRQCVMHLLEACLRDPFTRIENPDADHLLLLIEVEHDSWLYFLGLNDPGQAAPL